jgi:hypothetical protein
LSELLAALQVRVGLGGVGLRAIERGLRGGDLRVRSERRGRRAGEHRARRRETALRARLDDLHLRVGRVGLRLRRCELRFGLFLAVLVVDGVDLRDHVALLHRLVVRDEELDDVARDARRERHHVGRDLRVVRALLPGGERAVTHVTRRGDAHDDGEDRVRARATLLWRRRRRRGLRFFDGRFLGGQLGLGQLLGGAHVTRFLCRRARWSVSRRRARRRAKEGR